MRLTEDRDRRLRIFFNGAVLLLAIIGIARRSPVLEKVSFVERLMIDTLAPIQRGVTSFRMNIGDSFNHYFLNIDASKENAKLLVRIAGYRGEIFHYQEVMNENIRLKKLLKFGTELKYKKILAQVVAWDASSDIKVIRINKGSLDGLRLQYPVVTSSGLVGYIYRLTDHFADILTVLDRTNRMDGLVERVRAHGIVEGNNNKGAKIKYVSQNEPVILGDTVITSGLGNIYPKGIKIGFITRIEREIYGMTQDIEVTTSVDFGRLEEVIVLMLDSSEKKKDEWRALDEIESSQTRRNK